MTSDQTTTLTYDVIGDVHGQHDKLVALLKKLGYQKTNQAWSKAGHQAVFVGDLIDKGPKAAGVLKTVQTMVEAGTALMVVGNHELNWIQDAADYTADPIAFMDATEKHPDRRQLTEAFKYQPEALIGIFQWLREQPIYIDQPDLRIVHACWDEDALDVLKNAGIDRLNNRALAGYRDTYSDVYLAIDCVVAGCAHTFPAERAYKSEFRSERFRIQWWPENRVAINPIEIQPVAGKVRLPESHKAPVFFGHYSMVGIPDTLGSNIAGLDYSAAYGGTLTAYRHRPNQPLDRTHFVT
ncbi:MAG: metallophosphoesterase [Marinobacter sp. T13-3]|nr:MAG: metallophosphoesterase [Marinobacter sp. T13-3]